MTDVVRPHVNPQRRGPDFEPWKVNVDALKEANQPYCELRGDAPLTDEAYEFGQAIPFNFEIMEYEGVMGDEDIILIITCAMCKRTQEELTRDVTKWAENYDLTISGINEISHGRFN